MLIVDKTDVSFAAKNLVIVSQEDDTQKRESETRNCFALVQSCWIERKYSHSRVPSSGKSVQ